MSADHLRLVLLVLLACLVTPSAWALSAADQAALRAVALDYVDGWYSGDSERMASALHPQLAKRALLPDHNGGLRLDHMTRDDLVAATGQGFGTRTPLDQQIREIQILDGYGKAAVVRAEMAGWVDFLQMIQVDGEWKIINVLWELKPRSLEAHQ